MTRHVAFLAGMNLGGRRITNAELVAHVADMGFGDPQAFLASGNVMFTADEGDRETLERRFEEGLHAALGYEVTTFVRSAEEVRAIAEQDPFPDVVPSRGGKLQVAFLRYAPESAEYEPVLDLATDEDHLAIQGRELYWLPAGGISESSLDLKAIASAIGPMTVRTMNTVRRLATRLEG